MQRFSALISALLLCLAAHAASFPTADGERARYDAVIEMGRGYVSGVCILVADGGEVKGCLVNEFGISALDFIYNPQTKKVKLVHVIKLLDKWYIRRTLRSDLAKVMQNLAEGVMTYRNEKRKIDYKFTILQDATEE